MPPRQETEGGRGEFLHEVVEEDIISRETCATGDEVGGILGMFLRDFEQVIAEEDPEDEKVLQRMLGRDAEEAKQHDPLFARLTKEIVF
jgi:hypothetical protein